MVWALNLWSSVGLAKLLLLVLMTGIKDELVNSSSRFIGSLILIESTRELAAVWGLVD